eukprot:g24551.t1
MSLDNENPTVKGSESRLIFYVLYILTICIVKQISLDRTQELICFLPIAKAFREFLTAALSLALERVQCSFTSMLTELRGLDYNYI